MRQNAWFSTNQIEPINQSINQSTNQPSNLPTNRLRTFYLAFLSYFQLLAAKQTAHIETAPTEFISMGAVAHTAFN